MLFVIEGHKNDAVVFINYTPWYDPCVVFSVSLLMFWFKFFLDEINHKIALQKKSDLFLRVKNLSNHEKAFQISSSIPAVFQTS